MTSPDHAGIPPETQEQAVGEWGDDFQPELMDGLLAFFELVGGIVEVLTGVTDGDLGDLATWAGTLLNDLPAVVAAAVADMLDALQEVIDDSIVSTLAVKINDAIRAIVDIIFGGSGGYWSEQALVASAQVALGVNEVILGIALFRNRKITKIRILLGSNTGTLVVQTKLNGTTIHTATISSASLDNSYTVSVDADDGDIVSWNVTSSGGIANTMHVLVAGEYRS